MASGQMGRPGKSKEQKLEKELATLQSRYGKAKELLEKTGGMDASRMKGANRLLSQIDEVKQQLKDMRGSVPTPKPRPARAPELPDYGLVKPAPGSKLTDKGRARTEDEKSRAEERRASSGSSRPSTVDTKSKKPIAKRIMEALGDKRTMEQATKDREMNKRMEKETMGRMKGGMGQKKKDSVKKAYGGMVKKKQGGSANKANMKAGFTKRGCSKG